LVKECEGVALRTSRLHSVRRRSGASDGDAYCILRFEQGMPAMNGSNLFFAPSLYATHHPALRGEFWVNGT
jgi:hypothetical protein